MHLTNLIYDTQLRNQKRKKESQERHKTETKAGISSKMIPVCVFPQLPLQQYLCTHAHFSWQSYKFGGPIH